MDPATLTVTELVNGLRAGAVGNYAAEAAVELLIRHWTWLASPAFLRETITSTPGAPGRLHVSWPDVRRHAEGSTTSPGTRAVALIAAQLAPPRSRDLDGEAPRSVPLGWLLANLTRRDVDLVLAAIAHATGSHDNVEHLGEPTESGHWRITATSPRLRPGTLHPWPAPTLPGLE